MFCQHDVDDGHDNVDDYFDAAMLMVLMISLMVVEIYARFYHLFGEKVDSANIALWVKELNQDHGTKQIPIFQRPYFTVSTLSSHICQSILGYIYIYPINRPSFTIIYIYFTVNIVHLKNACSCVLSVDLAE